MRVAIANSMAQQLNEGQGLPTERWPHVILPADCGE